MVAQTHNCDTQSNNRMILSLKSTLQKMDLKNGEEIGMAGEDAWQALIQAEHTSSLNS